MQAQHSAYRALAQAPNYADSEENQPRKSLITSKACLPPLPDEEVDPIEAWAEEIVPAAEVRQFLADAETREKPIPIPDDPDLRFLHACELAIQAMDVLGVEGIRALAGWVEHFDAQIDSAPEPQGCAVAAERHLPRFTMADTSAPSALLVSGDRGRRS